MWRTPALNVDALDLACGREVWLKPECLQRTGSFKFRGATNAVARLPRGTEGVVCISSGNHAQAVARAAREAGIRCLAVMPIDSNPTKIAATAGYGAEVERLDVQRGRAPDVPHDASARPRQIWSVRQGRDAARGRPRSADSSRAGCGAV